MACQPVRFSRHATRLCCSLCAWRLTAGTRGFGACGRRPACGRHWATVFSWTTTPAPLRGGRHMPRHPRGAAQERSARGSAAQPPAESGQQHSGRALLGAWGTIVPHVQKLGLGHQLLLPRWTQGACRPRGGPALPKARARPGSHWAAKCSCLRTGAPGQRRYPPGLAGPAPPPKPSQSRAPWRLAGARPPPPRRWGLAPPRPWAPRTTDPRSSPNLTSRLTRGG